MKKHLRLWGLSLALIACVALMGHADCHCGQIDTTSSCNLCHSAVYTLPTVHVPTPIFYAQPSSFQLEVVGWEPSISAVNLTRGPPSSR